IVIIASVISVILMGAGANQPYAFQQTPQQAPPVFRGGADLVRIDVSVLDLQRKPIRGLTAEDFLVTEDGKAQPVVNLSEVAVPIGTTGRPVWARAVTPDVASNEVGDQRLFAIVLDGFNKSGPVLPALRTTHAALVDRGIREIVDAIINRMGPADVAAITGG